MIAIVVREEIESVVRKSLDGLHILYEKIGFLSLDEMQLTIKEIRSMDEIGLFILDEKVCADPKDILTAIKNYRFVREEERVLVIIDDKGNAPAYADLGIYDFVLWEGI
ncbi:hypothetical protein [Paenibacillus macquariensis]|uniref:Uncharacterized protein n=1 Tax=Paenibacillus macquariensis TaxID=948756 RepID=A0ABY1KEI9_9BACL|nr:hypothetical protein [Paenibacillus macquariensis]OAB28411.1 hypothetical protein PMSM_24455 [Paenibacillus macquariensis subsp. macquariensis]SIR71622.1 hypothetical protein SAMN05421578_14212 [Paenibacillus macquariensis]